MKHAVNVIAHETHANKSNPDYGVQTLAPHWRHGRVRLPGKQRDPGRLAAMKLVDEVTRWPDGATDDCVMAEWFFEVRLPDIFVPQQAPIQTFSPSWMQGSGRRLASVS